MPYNIYAYSFRTFIANRSKATRPTLTVSCFLHYVTALHCGTFSVSVLQPLAFKFNEIRMLKSDQCGSVTSWIYL